jgi:hypothetical protein
MMPSTVATPIHPANKVAPAAPRRSSVWVPRETSIQSAVNKALDPVALVTLLLVIVTWRMAASINDQVRLARDEFIATHRPRVTLRRAYAPVDDPLEGPIKVNYTLANVGETRAIIQKVALRVEFRPQSGYPLHALPIAEEEFDVSSPETGAVIEAGESREFLFTVTGQVWDLPRKRKFLIPNQGLFFIGLVLYADDAPRKTQRRTAWYRKYSIDSQSFGRLVWDADNEYKYAD